MRLDFETSEIAVGFQGRIPRESEERRSKMHSDQKRKDCEAEKAQIRKCSRDVEINYNIPGMG